VNPGDDDLFVFEFDAECRLFGFVGPVPVAPGTNDHVSVQARLNGFVGPLLGGSFLQPQNSPSNLEFCGTRASQSVSKTWAVRLAGGTGGADWTFSIWWQVGDVGSDNVLSGWLDDRTVRITRYN
jgi:hypothetical protein